MIVREDIAGRSGKIRTCDPHVPNVVRYQTALHSVTSGASINQASGFGKQGQKKWVAEKSTLNIHGKRGGVA